MRAAVWIYAIGLLIIGMVRHFTPIFSDLEGSILGDAGDGFFNLWVMTHNSQYFTSGRLQGILDGQIFFPNNANTMLLSDTLYLPSILFTLLEPLGLQGFARFNVTALILGVCSFFAHWLFFHFLWRSRSVESSLKIPNDKSISVNWYYFLVPSFAYLASFSSGRSIYYGHFQNISSFWVVIAITGCAGYLENRFSRWLYLAMFAFLAANYSTQYFGVLTAIIVLVFIICLLAEGPIEALRIAKRHWLALTFTVTAFAPLAWLYGRAHGAHSGNLPRSVIGISWKNFLQPVPGTGAFNFLNPKFGPLPWTNHELPAYLGFALIISIAIILVTTFKMWWNCVKVLAKNRFVQLFVAIFILIAILRDFRHLTAWPALLTVTVATIGSLVMGWKWRKRQSVSPVGFYLVAIAVLIYGLAFGPSYFFREMHPDPSLWGMWAWLVPGVHKMRAIGRMAPIGHTVLLGIVAWMAFRIILAEKSKKTNLLFGIICSVGMLIQACEHESDLYITKPSSDVLAFSGDENLFFGSLKEPILAFPVSPFHISTYAMLYFTHYPKINLMNGYSGSSTPQYDELIASGPPDLPSDRQVAIASTLGVDTFVVFKNLIGKDSMSVLKAKWANSVFENDRFYVFKSSDKDLKSSESDQN
jgi:hypothetical protein